MIIVYLMVKARKAQIQAEKAKPPNQISFSICLMISGHP